MSYSRIWAFTVLLLCVSAPACAACGPTLVYFYDEEYEQGGMGDCAADLVPGPSLLVHVLLESYEFPHPIREVQFRVDDWIGNPGEPLGRVTEYWFADQVSGSLEEGITLTWDDGLEPTGGGFVSNHYDLGFLEIEAFSPDWVGEDRGVRPFILGYTDVEGWTYSGVWQDSNFTFNGYGACIGYAWDPSETWGEARHFLPEDGAVVAPVFPLRFQVVGVACEIGIASSYEGTVSLEGEQIAEFMWDHQYPVQDLSFTVDASAYPPLSPIEIAIDIEFGGGLSRHYTLEYLVGDQTATESINLSQLKGLYR